MITTHAAPGIAHRPESTATVDPPAVTVQNLTKRYRDRVALDDVSFTVPARAVTGLVGPNGAGKTTLMAVLLGLVVPTSGTATVLGAPARRSGDRAVVGALIETPAFHPAASARANLRSVAALAGVDAGDVPELLELVGLADRADDRVGGYSLGMRQRLGIAAALVGRPELVILDEPSNGLDPTGMADVRAILRTVVDRGATVIVSSHLLAELEQVTDQLVVLGGGTLRYAGPPAGLGDTVPTLVLRGLAHADLTVIAGLAADTGRDTRIVGTPSCCGRGPPTTSRRSPPNSTGARTTRGSSSANCICAAPTCSSATSA